MQLLTRKVHIMPRWNVPYYDTSQLTSSFSSSEKWSSEVLSSNSISSLVLKMASGVPSPLCLLRLKKDIKSIHEDKPPGIFIVPDEKDIRLIHALIVGPKDTPYHGGFFYFYLKIPPNYPIKPPDVKLMTTDEGRVRFNPNLYSNGKVCLSILGTWSGPAWSAAQRLSGVLISIQSLMNERPLFNEPGMKDNKKRESDQYNQIIEHETLRVAVCGMLEGKTGDSTNFPQPLRDIMERQFLDYYHHYQSVAESKSHLTGHTIKDPTYCVGNRGPFAYSAIRKRLQDIKTSLEAKLGKADKTE